MTHARAHAEARNHGPPRIMSPSCSHLCWDRAGTAQILVHIRAGTEADLRCDWRNGGAHVSDNIEPSCLRMQADTCADIDAHSSSDIDSYALADRHTDACADIGSYALADRHAHACADVHVRACFACTISCTLWAHGHRHA